MVTSNLFDLVILALIILNIVMLSFMRYGQTEIEDLIQESTGLCSYVYLWPMWLWPM